MTDELTCEEAMSMAVPYIENRLSEDEIRAYIRHLESCPACMEELDIYFIVSEGIRGLDEVENENMSFDFTGALHARLKESRLYLVHERGRRLVRTITYAAAMLVATLVVLWFILPIL